MIKRYSLYPEEFAGEPSIEIAESENGAWVRFSDHEEVVNAAYVQGHYNASKDKAAAVREAYYKAAHMCDLSARAWNCNGELQAVAREQEAQLLANAIRALADHERKCPHGVPFDGPQCNQCSW